MSTLSNTEPVGRVASRNPAAARVLHRLDVPLGCGVGQPLDAACEERGLSVGAVLDEITDALQGERAAAPDWSQRSDRELIEYILDEFHRPMQEELPRLESLLDHVLDVHAEEDPDALGALEKAFIALRDELRSHSAREENILFPWILSADRMPEEDPMKVMLEEHGRVDELLDEIREIAGRSRIGAGACVPWLLLGQALAELVQSLQEHRRLEEGVLFPRVAPG